MDKPRAHIFNASGFEAQNTRVIRGIHERYVEESYDTNAVLQSFSVHCPSSFNFAYDVVDDIAVNDPDRCAMVWCNPEGEEHHFSFADMKTWSDKTASYLA